MILLLKIGTSQFFFLIADGEKTHSDAELVDAWMNFFLVQMRWPLAGALYMHLGVVSLGFESFGQYNKLSHNLRLCRGVCLKLVRLKIL
jgi:hypothetical protein